MSELMKDAQNAYKATREVKEKKKKSGEKKVKHEQQISKKSKSKTPEAVTKGNQEGSNQRAGYDGDVKEDELGKEETLDKSQEGYPLCDGPIAESSRMSFLSGGTLENSFITSSAANTFESISKEIARYTKWPVAPFVSAYLLADVVQETPKDKVLGYGVAPAFHPSDYSKSSFLFSVTFTFTCGKKATRTYNKDLLAKTLPPFLSGEEKTFREEAIKREVTLYGTTFPNMMLFLLTVKNCEQRAFFPTMFPVADFNTLIMQDMRSLGYLPATTQMMDGSHSVAVVLALARFHAASAALHNACPETVERFNEMEFVSSRFENLRYIEDTIRWLAQESLNWEGCALYHKRLLRLSNRIVRWLLRYFQYGSNHFHALIHGDLWTNNILFLHDRKGGVEHVCFVDYQKTRWAPAILDFLFFLFTSADDIMRSEVNWRRLLRMYEELLRHNLQEMKLEKLAPSMDHLLYDLEISAPYAAYVACIILPVALDSPSQRWNPSPDYRKRPSKHDKAVNESIQDHLPGPSKESASCQLLNVSHNSQSDGNCDTSRLEDSRCRDPRKSAMRSTLFQKTFPRVLKVLDKIGGI